MSRNKFSKLLRLNKENIIIKLFILGAREATAGKHEPFALIY